MSPTPVSSTILIFYSTATAEATYTYDPYGNTTATTGGTFATSTNPWRYGGGYTDPNGTIKFGARYYNPTTGRFTQPDPSGQESNRYLRRRQPHHQQLGVKTFSYDPAGRKISEHDGRGNTAYTCYDNNDRITQVSYTTAACGSVSGVTYTYDPAGNTTRRIDASGTTTIAYDAMNRPTSKSVGSTVTSVGYDPAGNITSYTDAAGTVNYAYDETNDVLTLAEPGGSCPAGVGYPNSSKRNPRQGMRPTR